LSATALIECLRGLVRKTGVGLGGPVDADRRLALAVLDLPAWIAAARARRHAAWRQCHPGAR